MLVIKVVYDIIFLYIKLLNEKVFDKIINKYFDANKDKVTIKICDSLGHNG